MWEGERWEVRDGVHKCRPPTFEETVIPLLRRLKLLPAPCHMVQFAGGSGVMEMCGGRGGGRGRANHPGSREMGRRQ